MTRPALRGSSSWQLDELAHAGREHVDPHYIATYDRKAGTDPTEDLSVLRALVLGGASTVVDMGAGTGEMSLAAAPLCRRVVAVDISPAMLDSLRSRAQATGIDNIETVQAGFLTYEHVGAAADFVYSRHAIHHLPDFWKALALTRIAAFLRPGGVLLLRDLIFSCGSDEVEAAIEAWLAGAGTDPSAGWTRAELETHLREEYSTFSWLLEPMLRHAGFEIANAEYSSSRIYAAYTCVRRTGDRV